MTKIISTGSVIACVPKTYEDTIKQGTLELYLDTSHDDVRHTIRHGEVVSSRDGRFAAGDTVWFHHNVVRRITNEEGNTMECPDEIMQHLYQIFPEEIYAVRKKDSPLKAISPYCFVKPLQQEEKKEGNLLTSFSGECPLIGTIKYGNEELEAQGVKDGDTVVFTPDSEYEYPIDGEKLYKMETQDIAAHVIV